MRTVLGEIPDEALDKLVLAGLLTIRETTQVGTTPGVISIRQTEYTLILRRDATARIDPCVATAKAAI